MDTPKNQKQTKAKPFTLKKQILSKLITLLLNYIKAKSQESADINFKKFKIEFSKQKMAHPLFDVNQPIGEMLALNGAVCQYYFDIVFARDDLPLFKLLLECGLKDINIEGVPILHTLISFRALKCLQEFLSIGVFARHFVNGEYSPLALAVSNYNSQQGPQSIEALQNIEVIQMMVEHPDFKIEYLKHEQQAVYLNPLLIAITNYHYNAVQYMLERGAPCASATLPVKGFDLLFAGFLNYYSAGHSGELNTGKKQNNYFLKREMMTSQNIMRLFYLLLNHTPQAANLYQLMQPEYHPEKIDIFFHINGMLEKNLKIKDGPLKFLLDILVSAGAGLFFHDLPKKLKEKYKNVPPSAEIVMPIISPSGQVVAICYSFSDFEAYLEAHHASFQVLKGLHQYLQNKMAILKPKHPNYAKAIQLAKKVASYVSSTLPVVELAPALVEATEGEPRSLLRLLSELIAEKKETIVDKDNLDLVLCQQKDGLSNILSKIPDEKSLLAIEKEPKAIHVAIESYFSCLPRLYHHLITLNQVYRQLFAVRVYERDFGLIRESLEIFNAIKNKIDFYSMEWIYYVIHVQKIAPEEMIKLVQALSTILDLVHKNTRINVYKTDRLAYYRMQYLMQTLLVDAYSKTGNITQAKKAFKQALLVLQAANNPNLFTNVYTTIVHHVVVINGFLNMMNFGMVHMPDMVHTHLCQIIQYEKGMILSGKFLSDLDVYLKNEIKRNHFLQINELLILLSKNLPQDKKGMLFEIIMLKNKQHTEFLQYLQLMIDREDLSAQIKLDDKNNFISVNFKDSCLTAKKISNTLPCISEVNDKIVTIGFAEILQEDERQDLFLAIKKINELALQKKQKQEMQALEAQMRSLSATANLPSTSTSTSIYTPTYIRGTMGHKPKKDKPAKVSEVQQDNRFLPRNKIITKKINITDLKKHLGLGSDYSDLITIHSSYSKNNKKFIAIKKSPEFLGFLTASCLFKNEQGEWGVNSVNPYGKNQHGVKCYKKLAGEHKVEYEAKLKASSSDRAMGSGKEIDYEGTKIIVYLIDRVLPHKKADKVFKL